MEVHPEVYRWLGALHVIDPRAPAPSVTRSGRVMLDEQTSMDFENADQARGREPPSFPSRPRPGEYRPTRASIHLRGGLAPRATRSVAPSRATRARSTLARVPKRAPSVPRARPRTPRLAPDPPPRGARASSSLSHRSHVPPDRASSRRACRQSWRPARHAPAHAPIDTCQAPRPRPIAECTTGTPRSTCWRTRCWQSFEDNDRAMVRIAGDRGLRVPGILLPAERTVARRLSMIIPPRTPTTRRRSPWTSTTARLTAMPEWTWR